MESKKYKKLLLEEKARILQNLSKEKQDEERIGSSWEEPKDLEDWANVSIAEELKLHLADAELNRLRDIEDALKRISKRKYGICTNCSRKIERARLQLLPWTKWCSKCAQKIGG